MITCSILRRSFGSTWDCSLISVRWRRLFLGSVGEIRRCPSPTSPFCCFAANNWATEQATLEIVFFFPFSYLLYKYISSRKTRNKQKLKKQQQQVVFHRPPLNISLAGTDDDDGSGNRDDAGPRPRVVNHATTAATATHTHTHTKKKKEKQTKNLETLTEMFTFVQY